MPLEIVPKILLTTPSPSSAKHKTRNGSFETAGALPGEKMDISSCAGTTLAESARTPSYHSSTTPPPHPDLIKIVINQEQQLFFF